MTVTGKDIRRPLAVGPDPRAPEPDDATKAAIERGEQLAIDAGMKWMTDFDEAESAGMALRIPIPAATLAAGLDSLVVFGVARSLSVAETADQLANLLDAHHYTDGFAFIRPGTPTNNTDDRRAGYSSDDPGHQRSFELEVAGTPGLDDNNALHTGTALGLRFDRILPTFGRVERGLERDGLHMRSMNTALWQVGLGLLPQQHDRHGSRADAARPRVGARALPRSRAQLRAAAGVALRRAAVRPPAGHVARSVAAGPWTPRRRTRGSRECSLALRDSVWRPAAAIGGAHRQPAGHQPDPDADLADVMRTDALSSRYRTRNVFGRHYLQHLQRFVGAEHAGQRSGADRAPAAARHSLAAPALADVECRLASDAVRAAGAGRRSVALAKLEPDLHRRAARRTTASSS